MHYCASSYMTLSLGASIVRIVSNWTKSYQEVLQLWKHARNTETHITHQSSKRTTLLQYENAV